MSNGVLNLGTVPSGSVPPGMVGEGHRGAAREYGVENEPRTGGPSRRDEGTATDRLAASIANLGHRNTFRSMRHQLMRRNDRVPVLAQIVYR